MKSFHKLKALHITIFFIPLVILLIHRGNKAEVIAQTSSSLNGYIHVCPNLDTTINNSLCEGGSIKGYVDDSGNLFVPNEINPVHVWEKTKTGDKINKLNVTEYDDWMLKLKNKGINSIHVRVDPTSGTVGVIPMQTMPLGYYYIADAYPMEAQWSGGGWNYSDYNEGDYANSLVDGEDFLANYPNCRYPDFSVTNCGSNYAQKFSDSNITKILESAEQNNIRVKFTLWTFGQYKEEWEFSAYNQSCSTPDGTSCAASEQGVLSNGSDFLFDAYACEENEVNCPGSLKDGKNILDYQKQFIDFFMKAWGESESFWMWEIMNEIHYLADWNSGAGDLDDNVDRKLLPWVKYIAEYIRSVDTYHRPVSISSVYLSWKDGSISDPRLIEQAPDGSACDFDAWDGDHVEFFLGCKNKMFDYVDVANVHNYWRRSLKGRYDYMKQMNDIWPDKPKVIGEFLPRYCSNDPCPTSKLYPTILEGQKTYIGGYPWHIEIAPFHNSVSYYWMSIIGTGGNGSVRKWMGSGVESWTEGSAFHFRSQYDHEHFSDIAVPTGKFIKEVDWEDWRNHQDWDQYITISNSGLNPSADFIRISSGDGNQVMLMFRSLNSNSTPIEIQNLQDSTYLVQTFDWLTGDIVETQTASTTNGSINISVDVRWTAEDNRDFRWNNNTNSFEGLLIDTYDSDYTNSIDPNLGDDWPRLNLSDATPGQETSQINKYRRNIGVVLIQEETSLQYDITNDGVVDNEDLHATLTLYGKQESDVPAGYRSPDIDQSGNINLLDYSYILNEIL